MNRHIRNEYFRHAKTAYHSAIYWLSYQYDAYNYSWQHFFAESEVINIHQVR